MEAVELRQLIRMQCVLMFLQARDCISAAYVEATCNANCIGMVHFLD